MGYIYIMTNPGLKDMVKIGYARNVEKRRKELSTSGLPYEYEVYATYETSGHLEDKKLHKMIDNLNPELRVSKNREFFVMTPQEAFDLLEAIAVISGTQNKLHKIKKDDPLAIKQNVKKPSIDFYECGLKNGDELLYINDPNVRVYVATNRKVTYKDDLTSLTAIVREITGIKYPAGPSYFTYAGENLNDLANRTQWKDYE